MCKENNLKGQISIFENDIFNIIQNNRENKIFILDGKKYTVTLRKCNYLIDGYKTEYNGDNHLLVNSKFGKRNAVRTVHKLIKKDIPIVTEQIKNKEYKIIDNVFKGVEDLFYKVQDKNLEDMEEVKKYEYINKQIKSIMNELIEKFNLSREIINKIEELDLLNSQLIFMETLYYFKQGLEYGVHIK